MSYTRLNGAKDCTVAQVTNSSNVTTTSTAAICSLTHTSKTGKVLVMGNIGMFTSRYTSSMQLFCDGISQLSVRTNMTTQTRLVGNIPLSMTAGTALTYSLCIASQDSGTTATFPAYAQAELVVLDI